MQNPDGWGQNCQESSSSMPDLSFDEAFDVTDFGPGPTDDNTSSPKISSMSSDGGGDLVPKGSVEKPIRRRSRASKKAPTTLLTANTKNFRALVQQFTGCHSAASAFGTYRGPINLNFEQCNYYSEKPEAQKQHQQRIDWNLHEEYADQGVFSFGTNNVAAVTPPPSNHDLFVSRVNHNTRTDPLTPDDFDIENLSMQDLLGPEAYSTLLPGTRNDDFWGY